MSTETITKHTKTPWSVRVTPQRSSTTRSKVEIIRATGDDCYQPVMESGYFESRLVDDSRSMSDAEHIVKCVNNHDALVSALNAVMGALNHDDVNVADIHAAIRYAHNALDTVEGGAA